MQTQLENLDNKIYGYVYCKHFRVLWNNFLLHLRQCLFYLTGKWRIIYCIYVSVGQPKTFFFTFE